MMLWKPEWMWRTRTEQRMLSIMGLREAPAKGAAARGRREAAIILEKQVERD